MNMLRPENIGKNILIQLNKSAAIIKCAEEQANRMVKSANSLNAENFKKAYEEGLLLGSEKVFNALIASTKITETQNRKLEQACYLVIKSVLEELLQDELKQHLVESIHTRIAVEIDSYSKQVDFEETKLTLELPQEIPNEDINKVQTNYPFLNITINPAMDSTKFILRSPYGEIESDPSSFISVVTEHLETSVNVTSYLNTENTHE